MEDTDQITAAIIDTAYRLHRKLGPGLLESACTALLTRMLQQRGFSVGLLINFGAPTLKEGLRRIVNDYVPSAGSGLRVNQRRRRHEPLPAVLRAPRVSA